MSRPARAQLVTGRYTDVFSVSCASPGNCAAAGDYEDMRHGGATPGFVVREQNGVWGRAINLPGPWASWNEGVSSVSCPRQAAAQSAGTTGTRGS